MLNHNESQISLECLTAFYFSDFQIHLTYKSNSRQFQELNRASQESQPIQKFAEKSLDLMFMFIPQKYQASIDDLEF